MHGPAHKVVPVPRPRFEDRSAERIDRMVNCKFHAMIQPTDTQRLNILWCVQEITKPHRMQSEQRLFVYL